MTQRVSRRSFLRRTAVAGTAGVVLPGFLQKASRAGTSPNEKLNIAMVGCGGRARGNLAGIRSENIVALCDVDQNQAKATYGEYPDVPKFSDWRKMLDKMDKQIDAVVVSTPDHTHAGPSVAAMLLGKHCYCEKPLSKSIYEIRRMIDTAKKMNVVTQMGTQIHAGNNYRRVVELVQGGAIGPVRDVHVWKSGKYVGGKLPTETPPVPEGLDWDLWLGPAPYRPYNSAFVPFKWRNWWDYGTGILGDFGCHFGDLAFWALDLKHPLTIEAKGPEVDPYSTSCNVTVEYTFPARGDMPPVNYTWYDGDKRPALVTEGKVPNMAGAVLFVGEKGMIVADYGSYKLLPEDKFVDFKPPAPTIPNSIGHHAEWINACKNGGPTTCNFDYSGALSEAVMLGVVSYRVGQKLEWDPKELKATNCAAADEFIRPKVRPGWEVA